MQCIPTFTFFFFFLFWGGKREGRVVKRIWTCFEYFSISSSVIIMRNGFFWWRRYTFFSLIVLDIAENYFGRSNEDALNRGFDDDSVTLRFVDCDARMQFQSWKSSILDFLRCIKRRSRDFSKKKKEKEKKEMKKKIQLANCDNTALYSSNQRYCVQIKIDHPRKFELESKKQDAEILILIPIQLQINRINGVLHELIFK